MREINVKEFMVAGFDGFTVGNVNYFDDKTFEDGRFKNDYENLNKNMIKMLKMYLKKGVEIKFITPSVYEKCS
jgi:hypothetical protein